MQTDRMMADAELTTGLCNWGGAEYFESEFRRLFAAMVYSLEEESHLTAQGHRGAELRLRAMLEARLQFIADRHAWPEIRNERIVRPIFILGLPRAGSTFLHTLMSKDPASRVPLSWEMIFPSPPPSPAHLRDDPRIERTQQILENMGLLRTELQALHPFGARQPEECHLMMELMALGDNLPACWRMPRYNKERAATDLRLGYRLHHMVLQNLQFRFRAERILLKNPGHVFYLEHLLSAYPDAQIIQTHRDPAKVIPSVAALVAAMRKASSDDAPPPEKIAMGNLRAFADGLTKAMEFRQQAGIDARFFDVHFTTLIRDPLATVSAIYDRFGLTLTSEARTSMQRWLDDPSGRTPKGQHTLEQYQLDEAAIDRHFGPYIAHYGIERERRS